MTFPCDGVRVLDLASGQAALVGMVLADYGADVVRIEPPVRRPLDDVPAYRQWNRGKRIHRLDLRPAEQRAAFHSLARDCDVVIENLRPSAAQGLGADWSTLSALNPALVVLSITGFGPKGRYADMRSYEGIVAAKCGQFVIQNGYRSDGPVYDAIAKGVFGAAMLGLIGVLAALESRATSGRGQHVETSLVQSTFVYSYDGMRHPDPDVNRSLSLVQGRDPHNDAPGYRIAECADGRWIQSGSFGPGIFENLMRALGIDEYFTDPRFAAGVWSLGDVDRRALIDLVDAAYRTRPLAEWVPILDEHDAAYGLFATTQEFMDNPQVRHNGQVVDVDDPLVGRSRQIGPLATLSSLDWRWPGPPVPTDAPAWRGGHRAAPPTQPAQTAEGALSGLRIVDLAMYAAAPGGPGLLADLGAEVIKVEPLGGDPVMRTGGELFARITRGKRRVAIDLKRPEGQEALHALVATADVVVHNFRPGVPERLGADFETLRAHNDRLVYVYAAAFGSSGPDARRPAFDPVISAMAGGEVLQAGVGNPPQQRQTSDHTALLGVGAAILLGIRQRDQTEVAQYVETTMLASAGYLFSDDFLSYEGKPARPEPDTGQYGLGPLYRLYRASEGWVFLACLRPAEWRRLTEALDPSMVTLHPDPFGAGDADKLAADLESAFATRPAAAWEAALSAAGVACVVADGTWQRFLFDEPGSLAPSMVRTFDMPGIGDVRHTGPTIDLSATPAQIGRLETLGESTVAVLSAAGIDASSLDALLDAGVIGTPPAGGARQS